MFAVYIKHWLQDDGTTIDPNQEWTLMFTVPGRYENGFPVKDPTVKCSEDSADSFDFTIEPGMHYYDKLVPLRTLFRVTYSAVTIFYGRALTINSNTVYQTRSVHCEGSLGFLNDSYYEGIPDKSRTKIGWNVFYNRLISNHNTTISDNVEGDYFKHIELGSVQVDGIDPKTGSGYEKEYEPTSWTQTSSLFNSLRDEIGGHLVMRYESGQSYLDWYKYYWHDRGEGNRPVVSVGKNIIDISVNNEIDNIFTRVIPVGTAHDDGDRIYIEGYTYTDLEDGQQKVHNSKAMPVELLPHLYTSAELTDEFHKTEDYAEAKNKFGLLYITQEFGEADTQQKLWDECKKWIKESYYGEVTTFEVRAVDMHLINTELHSLRLGECVDVYYKVMERGQVVEKYRKLVCKSVKYTLFSPENNSYTFSIPSDLLKTKNNSNKSSKNKKTASGSLPKGGGNEDQDRTLNFTKVAAIIKNDPDVEHGYGGDAAYNSFKELGEMSGTFRCYDQFKDYDPYGHPRCQFNARVVGMIDIPGKSIKFVLFSNSGGTWSSGGVSAVSASNPLSARIRNGLKYHAVATALMDSSVRGIVWPIQHWYKKGDDDHAYASYTYIGNSGVAWSQSDGGGSESGGGTSFGLPISGISTGEDGTGTGIKITESGDIEIGNVNLTTIPTAGSEILKKILNFGTDGKIDGYDPETGVITYEADTQKETTDKDGNKSKGQVFVGRVLSDPDIGFNVSLNEVVTYKTNKKDPTTGEWLWETSDGFVCSKDFNIDTIPSFKTQLAIVDTFIANQATVNNLVVKHDAYIKDLSGETVQASIRATAGKVTCGYLSVAGRTGVAESGNARIAGNVYAGGTFYLQGDGDNNVNIGRCYNSASLNETTGVITLSRANGSDPTTFNLADMAWHKNAVSAAKDDGASKVFLGATGGSLEEGIYYVSSNSDATITAYYYNKNDALTPTSPESPLVGTRVVRVRLRNDEDLVITPSNTTQTRNAAKDGYKKVTVNPAPAPTVDGPKLYYINNTEVSSPITTNSKIYAKVIVDDRPISTAAIEINVSTPTPTIDVDGPTLWYRDNTAVVSPITQNNKEIYAKVVVNNQEHTTGYVTVNVDTSDAFDNGGKTAYLSGGDATLEPGSSVTIDAYYVDHNGVIGKTPYNTSLRPIRAEIRARNLRTLEKTITPTSSQQTFIAADETDPSGKSYDGYEKVVVNAAPSPTISGPNMYYRNGSSVVSSITQNNSEIYAKVLVNGQEHTTGYVTINVPTPSPTVIGPSMYYLDDSSVGSKITQNGSKIYAKVTVNGTPHSTSSVEIDIPTPTPTISGPDLYYRDNTAVVSPITQNNSEIYAKVLVNGQEHTTGYVTVNVPTGGGPEYFLKQEWGTGDDSNKLTITRSTDTTGTSTELQYIVTADVKPIAFDDSTKKFWTEGYAKVNDNSIATSTKYYTISPVSMSYPGPKLTFGDSKFGHGYVKAMMGSKELDSKEITDYKDGWDTAISTVNSWIYTVGTSPTPVGNIASNGTYSLRTYYTDYTRSDGTQVFGSRTFTVDVHEAAPSYTVDVVQAGNDCPENDVTNFLAGYNPKYVGASTGHGSFAARQGYRRYIMFTVDGKKRAFYF